MKRGRREAKEGADRLPTLKRSKELGRGGWPGGCLERGVRPPGVPSLCFYKMKVCVGEGTQDLSFSLGSGSDFYNGVLVQTL